MFSISNYLAHNHFRFQKSVEMVLQTAGLKLCLKETAELIRLCFGKGKKKYNCQKQRRQFGSSLGIVESFKILGGYSTDR